MSYGRSTEERYRALRERFYLDDDYTIRRRPAEVHPSVRAAVGAERHKAYAAMLNRFAHQPISFGPNGMRYVRVYQSMELRLDDAIGYLMDFGAPKGQPMQVTAPEALWLKSSGTKARASPKARDRKAIRKTMAVVDGVIVWRPMDATQAGYLHPALEGLADGWNKRFAGKPVAVRTAGHSPYRYIKVGDRFMRVEQVIEMLKEEE